MMIRTSVCAAPWDIVSDPQAAERFAALVAGSDGSVSLAAAYHGVRAATPQHITHRFVDAPHSALYLPVREDVWRGHRLRPASAAGWTGDDDAFGTARAALTAAGVRTTAWVVLTHNDPSGADDSGQGMRVLTAFGDRLMHALCPSSDDVVAYCVTLVSEVAASGVDEIMLEAVGQLGMEHGGAHEKTAGAEWSPVDVGLMSICCCSSCGALLREAGVDADALAAVIRGAVGTGVGNIEDALGELAEPVLALRRWTTARLLDAVTTASRALGVTRLTAHAGLDPWATSSFSPLGPGAVPVDALVLSDAAITDLSASAIAALGTRGAASVAGYVWALPPFAPETLAGRWGALVERGVDELVVYHGGLISARRAVGVAAALDHVSRLRPNNELTIDPARDTGAVITQLRRQ